jgi:tRNA (mo5U34)-methyltransferase
VLEDVVDRVAVEIATLGTPEDDPLVGQVAEAMADIGFSERRSVSPVGTDPRPDRGTVVTENRPEPGSPPSMCLLEPMRSPDQLRSLADSVPFWFHSIDLGQDIVTRGVKSPAVLAAEVERLQLPDLIGKTVLDIGAWDGFFSFETERRGAARVVSLDHFMWAIDPAVSRYYQDCREQGLPPQPDAIRAIPASELPGKRGYDTAARVLGSKAEARVADFMTMDLESLGRFDIVLYLGVLYHMQDPLAALRRLASVTGQLAVIESEAIAVPGYEHLALCEFYEGSELNADASNWWAPNQKALEGMCRAAGFASVKTLVGPPALAEVAGGAAQSPIHYRTFVHAAKA